MSEETIKVSCSWCLAEFEGDAEQAAESGWFQFWPEDGDEPKDYCSMDCLISSL